MMSVSIWDGFWFVSSILTVIGMWKVFEKAGKPGWASLIPIYNLYVTLKLINKPAWWLILFFIPLINGVILIIVSIHLAKCFNKSPAFGLGLAFFPFVFYLILGYDDSKYFPPKKT